MELLQDPRWQKTRLRVFDRAGWKCEWCKSGEVNLQVHHGFYERGLFPWEYPDEALYCLCDNCHAEAERVKAAAYRELGAIRPQDQRHAITLLRELRRALREGVADDVLDDLTVKRSGDHEG